MGLRLLIACLMVADKAYEEENHSTEAYSLVSFVPIRDLVAIENGILQLADYQIIPKEADLHTLARGDLSTLFRQKNGDLLDSPGSGNARTI